MDLDAIAAELYNGPPEEFTALRKQRATEARAAGDRELAKQVLALRRPTRSAWIVNLIADQAADDLAALLDLGAALAEAQQRLSGADLRRLSSQRHAAIAALAQRGAQLAEVRGHTATEATRRAVSETLQAALSDPGIADRVRAGRLPQAQEYSGFGPEMIFAAGAAPDLPAPAAAAGTDDDDHDRGGSGTDDEDADAAEHERLIERLNTAQAALDRIRVQTERATERAAKAADTAAQRSTRVDELREQLDRAEREADAAAADRDTANDAVDDLRAAERAAEDAVSAALAALADG
ncbi:hypothetical protein [Microlunatus soli]|uniref:Uncharacterized protein n=1 Tax=Microlunatus soli TaxID=630515 RepID=A0A1H1VAJ6_9ACTN|nr:hypothetical protein [Microlunatus soli]SDS81436.1 hypothetical protein SAMN04489812_3121 [Microlunatus soli]